MACASFRSARASNCAWLFWAVPRWCCNSLTGNYFAGSLSLLNSPLVDSVRFFFRAGLSLLDSPRWKSPTSAAFPLWPAAEHPSGYSMFPPDIGPVAHCSCWFLLAATLSLAASVDAFKAAAKFSSSRRRSCSGRLAPTAGSRSYPTPGTSY